VSWKIYITLLLPYKPWNSPEKIYTRHCYHINHGILLKKIYTRHCCQIKQWIRILFRLFFFIANMFKNCFYRSLFVLFLLVKVFSTSNYSFGIFWCLCFSLYSYSEWYDNKGNNKITELRTILQRESKNS
jgi:hypothetical protein